MKFCSGQAFFKALRESEGKNVSRDDIFERAYQLDDEYIARNRGDYNVPPR